jgi:imidazolonepropionase-like amidohydrolase
VTVHAHALAAVEQAVRCGVDGIEHCTCVTEAGAEVSDRLLETLTRQRITVCPTLGVAPGAVPSAPVLALLERFRLTLEDRRRLAGRMHAAGVPLVSGTDGGISTGKPHGILPQAIAELVAGGVPTAAALASATSTAAEACGLGHRKGRLQAGYDADLLIIDGDPFDRIESLANPSGVMLDGRWAIAP